MDTNLDFLQIKTTGFGTGIKTTISNIPVEYNIKKLRLFLRSNLKLFGCTVENNTIILPIQIDVKSVHILIRKYLFEVEEEEYLN